jgi:hypothetical protein
VPKSAMAFQAFRAILLSSFSAAIFRCGFHPIFGRNLTLVSRLTYL